MSAAKFEKELSDDHKRYDELIKEIPNEKKLKKIFEKSGEVAFLTPAT